MHSPIHFSFTASLLHALGHPCEPSLCSYSFLNVFLPLGCHSGGEGVTYSCCLNIPLPLLSSLLPCLLSSPHSKSASLFNMIIRPADPCNRQNKPAPRLAGEGEGKEWWRTPGCLLRTLSIKFIEEVFCQASFITVRGRRENRQREGKGRDAWREGGREDKLPTHTHTHTHPHTHIYTHTQSFLSPPPNTILSVAPHTNLSAPPALPTLPQTGFNVRRVWRRAGRDGVGRGGAVERQSSDK